MNTSPGNDFGGDNRQRYSFMPKNLWAGPSGAEQSASRAVRDVPGALSSELRVSDSRGLPSACEIVIACSISRLVVVSGQITGVGPGTGRQRSAARAVVQLGNRTHGNCAN